jgi:hypothetical protein
MNHFKIYRLSIIFCLTFVYSVTAMEKLPNYNLKDFRKGVLHEFERQQRQEAEVAQKEVQKEKTIEVEQQSIKQEAEMIKLNMPLVAKGHEAIYQRFLRGVLIFRPQTNSEVGRVDLRVSDLVNPLEGTFNLAQCKDSCFDCEIGKYLSISTGYRKMKKPENANKLEIWLTPKFLIGNELTTTAKHFRDIYGNWSDSAPVGFFWTWGECNHLDCYDYLTTENMDNLSKNNLSANWTKVRRHPKCMLHDYAIFSAHLQPYFTFVI